MAEQSPVTHGQIAAAIALVGALGAGLGCWLLLETVGTGRQIAALAATVAGIDRRLERMEDRSDGADQRAAVDVR